MSRAERGRDIVQSTFGGALYQQGRGFYSALEFLAIVRGEVLLEDAEGRTDRVLPPAEEKTVYLRPSHDHARRLLVAEANLVDGVFADEGTRGAVRALLTGIEAPVPGRRRAPDKWQLRHFFPYPPEAIHYDAVERARRIQPVSVERYIFRGAGGLAHKVLRTDPDMARLDETRERLRALLANGSGAVSTLLQALQAHDAVRVNGPEDAFEDAVEAKSFDTSDSALETHWVELLREGVHRLVTRPRLSGFDRIEGIMHWLPWCVAMHQLTMARSRLEDDPLAPIVFDAGYKKGPVRSTARQHLGQATAVIRQVLLSQAEQRGLTELTRGSGAWWKGPRTFFTTTLFAVGALNANTGLRHFELRPQLLQAMVHALVDEPVSLPRLTGEILGERLRIVCDRHSAARLGGVEIDGRHLQSNGEALAARLDEVGLLRAFSDSTLMVGVHE